MTHPKEPSELQLHSFKPHSKLSSEPDFVSSQGDTRTVNNVMRHEYRVLSEVEKAYMKSIKDFGLEFHDLLAMIGDSREIALAKTRIEEAVMWAVKHITK